VPHHLHTRHHPTAPNSASSLHADHERRRDTIREVIAPATECRAQLQPRPRVLWMPCHGLAAIQQVSHQPHNGGGLAGQEGEGGAVQSQVVAEDQEVEVEGRQERGCLQGTAIEHRPSPRWVGKQYTFGISFALCNKSMNHNGAFSAGAKPDPFLGWPA